MKQFFLNLACAVCLSMSLLWISPDASAKVSGAENYPYAEMFTEGKEWTICHFAIYPSSPEPTFGEHYLIYVKVDGTKTIDGIVCKRLTIDFEHIDNHGSCSGCSWFNREDVNKESFEKYGVPLAIPEEVYVYEKDRKLYLYRNPGIKLNNEYTDIELCEPTFECYDLNISIGDSGPRGGTIIGDEIIYIDGKPHRKITEGYPEDWDTEIWNKWTWIEGIGCPTAMSIFPTYYWVPSYDPDLIPNTMIRSSGMLAYVKDNGKVIYDGTQVLRDLGMEIESPLAGVESVEETHQHSDKCYDLQGRPIDKPRHGELFIRDGKIQFNR